MIRGATRNRSGITLTEILISIMIMSIGVISIATLFPLGLIRMRNAQRWTRGAYLVESATADLGARNLLAPSTFFAPQGSPVPWFQTATSGFYNPLIQDTPSYGGDWGAGGVGRAIGPGLPVAYDPLWRCVTGNYQDPVGTSTPECRFGSGIGLNSAGYLRQDGGTTPSVHGLQRLSNFPSTLTGATIPLVPTTYPAVLLQQNNLAVQQTFVSPEDLILQDTSGDYLDPNQTTATKLLSPSPIVPALSQSSTATSIDFSVTNDWRYTWFFTGQLADLSSTAFSGDIVICENRQFGVDLVSTNASYRVSGETVVEAIWGYTSAPSGPGVTVGYGSPAGLRSVYLRWPNVLPDPDVKVGSWIADVTYERNQAMAPNHFPTFSTYPAQRCYWYQVAKKTPVTDDPNSFGGEKNYRMMSVWTTTPVRAQSPLQFTPGAAAAPMHVEAALIMPSVVNVYPRTIYTR